MNKIADYREQRGITQRELAKLLNVSYSAIAMWETGARTPSLQMAKKIADYFNTNIDTLFFEKTDNKTLA